MYMVNETQCTSVFYKNVNYITQKRLYNTHPYKNHKKIDKIFNLAQSFHRWITDS